MLHTAFDVHTTKSEIASALDSIFDLQRRQQVFCLPDVAFDKLVKQVRWVYCQHIITPKRKGGRQMKVCR